MKSITIGRDAQNDIAINNQTVSRQHCVLIDHGNGGIEIQDKNSTNGTFVNGKRISIANLKNGDSVRLGDYEFEWSNLFSKETQLYKPKDAVKVANKIEPIQQNPNVHVHISQEGKHKGLEAWDTGTRGLLNFAKSALYIALAIIFFYIVYLIFRFLV